MSEVSCPNSVAMVPSKPYPAKILHVREREGKKSEFGLRKSNDQDTDSEVTWPPSQYTPV